MTAEWALEQVMEHAARLGQYDVAIAGHTAALAELETERDNVSERLAMLEDQLEDVVAADFPQYTDLGPTCQSGRHCPLCNP